MTERKRNKFSRHDSIGVMEEKIKASLTQKSRFTGHGLTDIEAGYLVFSLKVVKIIRVCVYHG